MKTKCIFYSCVFVFRSFFVEFSIKFGFPNPFFEFKKTSIKLHHIKYLKCSYGLAINFRLLIS